MKCRCESELLAEKQRLAPGALDGPPRGTTEGNHLAVSDVVVEVEHTRLEEIVTMGRSHAGRVSWQEVMVP